MAQTMQHHPGEAHHGHHIIPFKVLATVFGVLVVLTIVTVITARIDLGSFNVPLALAIAVTKAILVVSIFMALRYDNKVNTLVFAIGIVFVVVFLVFTLLDTAFRGSLGIMEPGTIADQQRADEALRTQEPAPAAVVAAPVEEEDTPAEGAVGPDGAAVFTAYLCNSCHTLDGSAGVGPSLGDVGSRLSREEIDQSIMEPDAVVTEGYGPGIMSATLNGSQFYDRVTPEELTALIDYLVAQTGN